MASRGRAAEFPRDLADVVTRGVLGLTPPLGWRLPRGARWMLPAVASALVALVQSSVFPEPSIAPFVFFYVAVALTAGLVGRGPGLLCVLLSAVMANYLFMAPGRTWSVSPPALVATGLFLLAAGMVALVCASLRTSLLRLEASARELERRGELLGLAHDAILVWKLDGTIEFWNRGAEQLYGYSSGEARGRLARELLQTVFPQPWEEIRARLRAGSEWKGELTHRTRDGRTVVVSANLQFVTTHDGVERVLEANRDVTESKRSEAALQDREERLRALNAQLREADQRKDAFLGMLSHELRNPLAPIRNSLFILDHAAPASPQARRAKEIVRRQVAHMTRLVDDLLDVTRIARGKIDLRRSDLDLGALVRRAADDHRPLMQQRGLALEIITPPAPVIVNGDETRLAQVLGNLLQNAAKFTPAGGRVRLAVGRRADTAVVQVSDTGLGMDPGVLRSVFEPFVQADQTIARSEGGLGLGLALVKGIVEMHGGDVVAQSAGRGRGAEFVVTLPLDRRRTLRARPPRSHGDATALVRRRVLVVDDNRDAAETLAELLEMEGHEVAVAHDGPGAVASALANRPDIVLCDIGLPGMDGYEVARQLRASGARGIRLVAVSGHAQPDDVARAVAAGFDAHVAKPPDPARLASLLQ